jgi:hypothetical protein
MSDLVDDPPLVLRLLEMWIRKEEEHFLQLTLDEEVRKVFHRVRSKTSYVRVAAWILQIGKHCRFNFAFLDKICSSVCD